MTDKHKSAPGTPDHGTPDTSREKIDKMAHTGIEGQQDSNPGDPVLNDATDSSVPNATQPFSSGLQASGEFRVGEKITFGVRNGNILVRKAGSGDEIEVSESTMAGIFLDTLFGPDAKKYAANIDRG